jgi:aryl-alcohol dehydrogenase-like predicted oxidoreductase
MRPLGKTGLAVTEVGLGGVFIKEGSTPHDEAIRVVHRALESGVNYLDTAPFYGNSQEVLGEALAGRNEAYYLGTKCGRWDWKTGPYRELDAYKVQFEQTLRDLRRDSVDILYIHEADWSVFWQDQLTPRSTWHIRPDRSYDYGNAPVTRFLLWAKEQRMANHLGISGNNAHLLAKILQQGELPVGVILVALQYSLIWRNAKEYLLPLARELGVGVVLGAPLQQGRLAVARVEWIENPPAWMDEDLRTRFESLYAIHQETGISLAALAIRFLLAERDAATVITGAATVEQLEENLACAALGPLRPDLHARLDALGRTFDGVHGVDY